MSFHSLTTSLLVLEAVPGAVVVSVTNATIEYKVDCLDATGMSMSWHEHSDLRIESPPCRPECR